ncbi:thiamine pyrophosphate-binding protein [Paraburkholderia domus]|uniref:thiamine pyrophosphate-binding protein n=1 Tax=Paraburkholderia domus TaxID=2793075 RepID=UPI0019147CDB|nr:thiamine pyrophosphate-binding protein [Paraburkholderia domus]MBK5065893.1 thiamine pyrophosphate-binding protein [Burkholderia sp. R-70199]CAE6959142.1 Acetolactate synthase, catabolic [Paraburkholderia domus]
MPTDITIDANNETGTLTAADIIAQRLYAGGCRYAFGIPGGEVILMIDALRRAGIRFILAKHENSAGFMAEGTYHLTGAPGILVATLGPGVANGLNVVANALQDRVPLIVLTGCVDPEEELTYTHQVVDHAEIYRPITKATLKVTSGSIAVLADKAVNLSLDGRPGPVHIDLPISATRARHAAPSTPIIRSAPSPVAPAAGANLDEARLWLSQAKKPLMIAGLDAMDDKSAAAVERFCRQFNVPLITTYKAKGIIAEDDPLSLGGAGLSPRADEHLLPLVRAADLLILAGYDPVEMRIGWRNVWDTQKQRVLEISREVNEHYMHQAGISFVADIEASLHMIGEGVDPKCAWPEGETAAAKAKLATAFGQGEVWGPAAIVETVRANTSRNAIATVDSGAHRILQSQIWECYGPRTLLQSSAFCTMGCALPLAIGAKVVEPEREVIAFTGDAGLEMVLGELATARDLKAGVKVVVFVDTSLALIELKQRNVGLENYGVDFEETDFKAVADALGGSGFVCESREELEQALVAAPDDTFSLFACKFERKAYDGRI